MTVGRASRIGNIEQYEIDIASLEAKLSQVQYLIKEYDQVLETLLLHFENIAEHECMGHECSECSPSIMAGMIIKVWDIAALRAVESE